MSKCVFIIPRYAHPKLVRIAMFLILSGKVGRQFCYLNATIGYPNATFPNLSGGDQLEGVSKKSLGG